MFVRAVIVQEMRRINIKIPSFLFLLTAVALMAAACATTEILPPTSSTTSSSADSAIETEVVNVLDPVHDRPFELAIWQPVSDPNDQLVVISHGFAGDNTSHATLATALAELGYTVAAPTHPDLAGLESGQPDLDPLVLRPRHLSLAIDYAIADNGQPFGQVTVVGHSMGGYSAQRLAGAIPDVSADEHCAANPNDPVLCTDLARARIDALVASPTPAGDERIDRLVLLAPAYGPLFSSTTLNEIDIPVMVVQASGDEEVPAIQIDELVAKLPASTTRQMVEGGHYVFQRPCNSEKNEVFPQLCLDPQGTDRTTIHAELVGTIASFTGQ